MSVSLRPGNDLTGNIRSEGLSREYLRGDDESGGKEMSRTLRPRCKSRERPPEPTVGQKKLYRWYSNWKILQFTCEHCGWTGEGEKTFPNEGGLECRRCDRAVAYVQFPSLRDTEQAAATARSHLGHSNAPSFGKVF